MRVIVTGGAGFIGSHVVELYARKGNDVLVLDDLSTGRMEWIADLVQKRRRVAFDLCDIRDRNHVRCSIMGFQPQVICHLAAQPAISTSWDDPILTVQVNELGTLNILDAVIDADCGTRLIFASTSAVYRETSKILYEGNALAPTSPYGASKLAAETYIQELWKNSVLLRLGNVFGPRQMPIGKNQVVPLMIRHLLFGEEFSIYGDGRQERDYIYATDVAEAFLMAAYGTPGIYNVCTGHSVSVNEIASLLAASYGATGYEWCRTPEQDPRRQVLMDSSRARDGLCWEAHVSPRDGISLTAEWWNNRK